MIATFGPSVSSATATEAASIDIPELAAPNGGGQRSCHSMRSSTSVSQASGSTSFGFDDYAERQTMPCCSARTRGLQTVLADCVVMGLGSVRHSSAVHSASTKASRWSFGRKWIRLPRSYGFSFARAASLSARWACR